MKRLGTAGLGVDCESSIHAARRTAFSSVGEDSVRSERRGSNEW